MIVNRLQQYNGDVRKLGRIILHGNLKCIINSKKPQIFQVFLFEKTLLFAEKNYEKFIYKNHIKASTFSI